MGARQREWARKVRDGILDALGNKCAKCPATDKLQFDCVDSNVEMHWQNYDWSQRMSFYRRQFKAGNLQLLCNVCHGQKTRKDNPPIPVENEPF